MLSICRDTHVYIVLRCAHVLVSYVKVIPSNLSTIRNAFDYLNVVTAFYQILVWQWILCWWKHDAWETFVLDLNRSIFALYFIILPCSQKVNFFCLQSFVPICCVLFILKWIIIVNRAVKHIYLRVKTM